MKVLLVEWEPDETIRGERMHTATHLLTQKLKKKYPAVASLRVVSPSNRRVELDVLVVHKNQRKQGVGSSVVKDVTAFAKRHKATTTLYPVEKNSLWGTTSKARLHKFYRRHGFKKADHSIGGGYMVKEGEIIDPRRRLVRMKRASHLLADKLRAENPEVKDLNLDSHAPRTITLHLIQVDPSKRSSGVGSKILHHISRFADRHKSEIKLWLAKHRDAMGTTSQDRLQKFYSRFGFYRDRGADYPDYDGSTRKAMRRAARKG